MTAKDSVFHVISNTHWDREWRFPFQRNRQMLVDMIDAVLHILETEPEYRAFHLDSQSIVLRDYLEIKPHRRPLIEKLTRENRLLHGPWYILPEEFQVGGENLIRNLLIGHKVSNQNGGVSKIGYSPFSWGQISQLPQIYKQFNINLIMFYRGINSLDSPRAEFLWEGADGTRMISSRFSTMPRYNFYFYIYRPAVHNEGFYDVEYHWDKGTTPFHFADRQQQAEDYFIISPHNEYYPENLVPQVEKIIADQAADFTTPHKIWMEGHDSSGPNRLTVDIIRDIKASMPWIDVRHSTLEEYAKMVFESVNTDELKLVTGERRSSQNNNRCGNLFGYTTSARMYLKQANFDAERWLQYYAEPFNVFSGMFGRDINDLYPETAWEMLVQNSAHDSIGGCSLDAIHADMMCRYKQVVEIAKGVFERAVKHLTTRLNTRKLADATGSTIFLTAINPTAYDSTQVVDAFVDIPLSHDKGGISILDENGNAVAHQLVARRHHQPVLEQMINRPMFFDMIRYELKLKLSHIPTFGMKAFAVVPSVEAPETAQTPWHRCLENEYLRVDIEEDGSISMMHKPTATVYRNIAWLESEGEAGHAWVHKPVGPIVTTRGRKADIDLLHNGPVWQEVKITHKLLLPSKLADRSAQNPEYKENTVVVRFGLAAGEAYLHVNIEVDNQSESHRLRLMLPTGLIDARYSWGEGQFDVPQRSLDRPDTSDWIEQPMYDFPMHHFVDVSDGKNGLAVLVDGLKEYEVLDDQAKTLAITLLRTFEYKINPSAPQDYSYEKGAQMPGRSAYRLAIFPHAFQWHQAKLYQQAFSFNYPYRLVQTGPLHGTFETDCSLLQLEGEGLVFGALKKPEQYEVNTAILRLYNPTGQPVQGKVCFAAPVSSVVPVNLEEIPQSAEYPIENNSFSFEAGAGKILSWKINFKPI
ncbi:MAG TPA: glycoside hydrolase family 38 C-terminal domain-containing protein [Bacteroidales bacterium]|nr:glycoside hydrolase family 38 C-terminal domain-containing protein [Bacteroidales bacterium]